jgi:hypothetical protein
MATLYGLHRLGDVFGALAEAWCYVLDISLSASLFLVYLSYFSI